MLPTALARRVAGLQHLLRFVERIAIDQRLMSSFEPGSLSAHDADVGGVAEQPLNHRFPDWLGRPFGGRLRGRALPNLKSLFARSFIRIS